MTFLMVGFYPLGVRPRHPTCEMREILGSVPCSCTALRTEKRPGPQQLVPGHSFLLGNAAKLFLKNDLLLILLYINGTRS